MGDLHSIERTNSSIIADWTASQDALARARLGDLRKLIRDKAGSAGQSDNLISRVDILAVLNVGHEADLLPCPDAFPAVGSVVKREQTDEFLSRLPSAKRWLVHAAGGVGKTVFLQSIASELALKSEVVLFDCFGGGAYRSVADGRHRPERGLMHLANDLACRGLCDPILPGSSDPSEIIRRSIQRFEQAIQTLRRRSPNSGLFIILDAIDNAAIEARDRYQYSFPKELLLALSTNWHPDGLTVIATSRSERRELSIGDADCAQYELAGFSRDEAHAFLRPRRPDATAAQVDAAFRRSNGNPRVLATLLEDDSALRTGPQDPDAISLESLLQTRLDRAIALTTQKGADARQATAFLCALTRLPPPVPTVELAKAFGLQSSEVESFAADMSPLLEQTRHGLTFRDEPTETLVREKYGSRVDLLDDVVGRLEALQTQSAFAARSLPNLLLAMGKVDHLRRLAFDNRFPAELDSEVARHDIRLNRLRAGLGAAAIARDFDASVDLLVELSSVVAADERGEDYLCRYPDLVVAAGDSEMLRRLFEARGGWFGSRPARLSIAYTTDDDTGEAYGHAKRLEEWLHWLHHQDWDDHKIPKASKAEHTAISFFLVARGRLKDAVSYLRGWNESYQYLLGVKLLSWLRSSALHQKGILPEISVDKLRSARSARPPIVAALLSSSLLVDAKLQKLVIRHLAAALKKIGTLKQRSENYRDEDSYEASLVRSGLLSVQLKLQSSALSILSFVATGRYKLWVIRDNWHPDQVVPWVLIVAASSAAKGAAPSLFDCLPEELWQLVASMAPPECDEQQRKAVEQRLKDEQEAIKTSPDGDKKRRYRHSELEECSSALRSRIGPILELCRRVWCIVSAETNDQKVAAADAYCAAWHLAAESESRWSYDAREHKRFFDRLYALCFKQVIWALGRPVGWNGATILERLKHIEFPTPEMWIKLVDVFAAHEEWHEFSGTLVKEAVRSIQKEDDVERRAGLFSDLARAFLSADKFEARALFKRGLSELDAIGSGDHDFTSEALNFASTLRDAPLAPEAAFRLAKICELNNYDSHKFPWPLAGEAFSRAWGPAYLAQLARWHDRDKAALELTLPTTLTSLIKAKKIPAEDGVALLGLVEPVEMWDWGWHDLIDAILSTDGSRHFETIENVVNLCERSHPTGIPAEYARRMIEALTCHSSMMQPIITRIESLKLDKPKEVVCKSGSVTSQRSAKQDSSAVPEQNPDTSRDFDLRAVNPCNQSEIEKFVDLITRNRTVGTRISDMIVQLRQNVKFSERSTHIEAIVAVRNLEIVEKLEVLESAKEAWEGASPSQLSVLTGIGVRLVRQHAEELCDLEWGFPRALKKMSDLSSQPLSELALALIGEATTRDLEPASKTWLKLATILSPVADPTVPKVAMERLLSGPSARLTDGIGDGLWRKKLDAGSDTTEITASMVWFALGSPKASERWRAAHVVRTLARFGRWQVIAALVGKLDHGGAGAFQDQALPFFGLHARKWLLLGLARLAKDYPSEIAHYAAQLEGIAFDQSFPHVGLGETAKSALLSIYSNGSRLGSKNKLRQLECVNTSALARVKEDARPHYDGYAARPKDRPEPNNPFHFEYDFNKHELASFGRIFGIPNWEVGDYCTKWIRSWDSKIKYMSDNGGRSRPYDHRRGHDGVDGEYHSFGAYLAWHALALVGGELLKTHATTEEGMFEDPWMEWLSGFCPTRKDGLWLADGTQSYPTGARISLRTEVDGKHQLETDVSVLSGLCGLTPSGHVSARPIVDGSWTSPDGVAVRILSALVPPKSAAKAAQAVATAPPFHRWLPILDAHDDQENRRRWGADWSPVEAWMVYQEPEAKLDGLDPFGSKSALSHSYPSRAILKRMGLRNEGVWKRNWKTQEGGAAFEARAWGVKQGAGDGERWEKGNLLEVDVGFLGKILRELDRSLLVLIKLSHYRERRSYDFDDDANDGYSHSLAVATIDKALNVEFVQSTAETTSVIDQLSEYDKPDFHKRYDALRGLQARHSHSGLATDADTQNDTQLEN